MHKVYRMRSRVDWELAILVLDGLGWIATVVIAMRNPQIFFSLLLAATIFTELMAVGILVAQRQFWAIKYMPFFIIFQLMNVASYTFSFFRALAGSSRRLPWQKIARYGV